MWQGAAAACTTKTMPRIPYPDPASVPDELKGLVKDRLPLNIYRMLMHTPRVMPGWLALGTCVLQKSRLDRKLRELAILRVGHLSKAPYEVHQHRKLATAVGLSDAKIAAAASGPTAEIFDARERALLQFTDEVVGQVKSSDATFAALQQHFDSELILEILITVGMYMTAARIMENLEIDIEADGGPSMDVVRERAASVIAPSKE